MAKVMPWCRLREKTRDSENLEADPLNRQDLLPDRHTHYRNNVGIGSDHAGEDKRSPGKSHYPVLQTLCYVRGR